MFGPSGLIIPEEKLERYAVDRIVLDAVLPKLRHCIWMDGRGAVAEGSVDVDVGAGCWEEVGVVLEFDTNYPAQPVRVYDKDSRWRPDPDRHIMLGGEFCLWLENVDAPDFTDLHGFEGFLHRLLLFLRDQFVFDDIGKWPGQDWPHGPIAAYATHMIERLEVVNLSEFERLRPALCGAPYRSDRACPCGSKVVYGQCHKRAVDALSWMRSYRGWNAIVRQIQGVLRAP